MSDIGSGGFGPPPSTGAGHAAGMANAAHAAHEHRRLINAEKRAELKASRGSRFPALRQLLARLTRRTG